MSTLIQQYRLVQSSRAVMLDFIGNEVGDDVNTPVPAFDNKSISFMLTHIADVYKNWLANFGMNMLLPFTDVNSINCLDDILPLYVEADQLTLDFITRYEGDINQPITNIVSAKIVTLTAVELFTHVITHEFHHKGQMMGMCRLLGHIPPDTDIIRT